MVNASKAKDEQLSTLLALLKAKDDQVNKRIANLTAAGVSNLLLLKSSPHP